MDAGVCRLVGMMGGHNRVQQALGQFSFEATVVGRWAGCNERRCPGWSGAVRTYWLPALTSRMLLCLLTTTLAASMTSSASFSLDVWRMCERVWNSR